MKRIIHRHAAAAAVFVILMLLANACNQGLAPSVELQGGLDSLPPFERAKTAVVDGDLAYIQACVESDARYVLAFDDHYRTLLHYAAAGDQVEIVRYLLENGARASAQDDEGYLPADVAMQEGASQSTLDLLRKASKLEAGQS